MGNHTQSTGPKERKHNSGRREEGDWHSAHLGDGVLELGGLKALQKYKYCYHTYIL